MKPAILRTGFSLMVLAMSLTGCANYSGLDTSGVNLDAKDLHAANSLKGVTLSPAAWPERDWWKSLGDPQLDGLITEALRVSPDMQVASARTNQASAAAYAANAARLPTVDAIGGISRSRLARDQDPTGIGGTYATVDPGRGLQLHLRSVGWSACSLGGSFGAGARRRSRSAGSAVDPRGRCGPRLQRSGAGLHCL